MKGNLLFSCGILIYLLNVSNCSKNIDSTSNKFQDTLTIQVDSCANLTQNNKNYKICLDSIWDSRCATGAVCVWAGLAKAKLTCNINSINHTLYLSTTKSFGLNTDTTISGLNFHLQDVIPHPAINIAFQYSDYKAKIVVSQ